MSDYILLFYFFWEPIQPHHYKIYSFQLLHFIAWAMQSFSEHYIIIIIFYIEF